MDKKKWKKPELITITEEELKKIIVSGACSGFCLGHGECTYNFTK